MKKAFIILVLNLMINSCGMDNNPDFSKKEYEISDIKGPTVVSVYPLPDSKNVPLDSLISINFSEPVFVESVDEISFYVQSKTGRVRGTYIFSDDSKSVYFIPEKLLEPLTQYSLTLNNRITDLAGNELVDQDVNDKLPATPFYSVFTTCDGEQMSSN